MDKCPGRVPMIGVDSSCIIFQGDIMNTKEPNQRCISGQNQGRDRSALIKEKRRHFERIAIGNALSEIEQEAELKYFRQRP